MNRLKLSITGFLILFLQAGGYGIISANLQEDTLSYHPVQGKIVDIRTGNPIIFANIYLAGTNIGTVSNSEGEFIIKIPLFIEKKILIISSIGYKNKELSFDQFDPEKPLHSYSDMEMTKLWDKRIPFVEVCTSPREKAIPALENKLSKSSGKRALRITQALAMLGAESGSEIIYKEMLDLLKWLSERKEETGVQEIS